MSSAEGIERATEAALTDEFRSAIDDARARVTAVVEPSCPSTSFLEALRTEVERALGDPSSVPYPELADPDQYWQATVRPQTQSIRSSVIEIVEWLERRIITTMEVAETDLKSMVDAAAADPGLDPDATRTELAAAVDERCIALHHQMAEVTTVLPRELPVHQARQTAADAMRAVASADVEGLKAAYMRDAGGDEDHQRFAEQQWSETFAERVAHREAMLAGSPPWRHQELALVGYERALADVELAVDAIATRLQVPLTELPGLLMARFDESVTLPA